ncbi:MAG TPA: biotin/lipoyl-containing protein, partial [Burkholderiales bacterium]|nr:biotin/lipoyl-containing protein [Burkholderiales bacterium]
PVTELVTGLDLVEWQLRVAHGEPLPLAQEQLAIKGHAIEARVYAEDPARGFLPAAGRIEHLCQPEQSAHVRVDSGVQAGDEVGVHYDPMIAKLIAWDLDRPSALRRLRAALGEFQIVGLTSNLAFLSAVTAHRAFADAHHEPGLLDTGLIERFRTELFKDTGPASDPILAIAILSELLRMDREAAQAAMRSADPYSPWNARDGWRLNEDNHHTFVFMDADKRVEVVAHYRNRGYLLELPGGTMLASGEVAGDRTIKANLAGNRTRATVVRRANELTVFAFGGSHRLKFEAPATVEEEDPYGRLVSPLPGAVIQVLIRDGESVRKGQALMIIEAMKMEHTISAPQSGTVKRIYFTAGEQVAEGAQLLEFEETAKA